MLCRLFCGLPRIIAAYPSAGVVNTDVKTFAHHHEFHDLSVAVDLSGALRSRSPRSLALRCAFSAPALWSPRRRQLPPPCLPFHAFSRHPIKQGVRHGVENFPSHVLVRHALLGGKRQQDCSHRAGFGLNVPFVSDSRGHLSLDPFTACFTWNASASTPFQQRGAFTLWQAWDILGGWEEESGHGSCQSVYFRIYFR